jgi:excisionase family DNA binding protein
MPHADTTTPSTAGLTVRELAKKYRVGRSKILSWIRSGEIRACNTAATLYGRPRWVIGPDALAEFEKRRSGIQTPKTVKRRKRIQMIDFFPCD